MVTFEEYRNEIFSEMANKPNNWRKGQFVFNYIDAFYGVARCAQFEHHIDCFYNDDAIDEFIVTTYNILKNIE